MKFFSVLLWPIERLVRYCLLKPVYGKQYDTLDWDKIPTQIVK